MDTSFHKVLYKMMHATHFYEMLNELHKKTLKYRGASVQSMERAEQSVNEHRLIFDAIANREEDKAEKLILIHIENARKNILNAN